MPESRELQIAREAARAGGAIVARYFREGVTMRSKDVSNLVSDADLESEHAVVGCIRAAFPGHEVLGEEAHAGNTAAEHLWIVDPLDGTNNFAHRIPQCSVSVAYYRAGVAQVGVIYNPMRDEWHEAERGQGARFNGEPVRVNDEAKLSDTLVGVGFYYERGAVVTATLDAVGVLKRREKIHGIRRFGSATLDLCMVGLGQLGAYFEYTLAPWDFAAGRLFVEEAGGRVTSCLGDPLPLAQSSILATNGHLHDAMLAIVAEHYLAPEA
ncbi:MAG: inositol monophosphatase family protein [Isosphaeraceae bacterium]